MHRLGYCPGGASQVLGGCGGLHCRPVATLLLPPDAYLAQGVRELQCNSLKKEMQGTAITTDRLRSSRLSTSCSPSSSRSALHVLYTCTTRNVRSALAAERSTRYRTSRLYRLAVVQQRTQASKATCACPFDATKAYDSVPHALRFHHLLQCVAMGPTCAIQSAIATSIVCTRRRSAGCVLGQLCPCLAPQPCGEK